MPRSSRTVFLGLSDYRELTYPSGRVATSHNLGEMRCLIFDTTESRWLLALPSLRGRQTCTPFVLQFVAVTRDAAS